MINEKAFLGLPSDYKGICWVYPPKIMDVVGDSQWLIYKDLLTKEGDELKEYYQSKGIEEPAPTPLEYILGLAYSKPEYEDLIKKAFFFFIHEEVNFLYDVKSILIGRLTEEIKVSSVDKLRILDADNYYEFQNYIRLACGGEAIEEYVPDPDEDPRITRMKEKARLRDRIKRKKGNVTSKGEALSLCGTLNVVCQMGLGITPLNIGEISYAALGGLIRYYQEKRKYETDVSSLIAGADSKKVHPKDWIRNIDD